VDLTAIRLFVFLIVVFVPAEWHLNDQLTLSLRYPKNGGRSALTGSCGHQQTLRPLPE
jgi:hypothetical protein